MAKNWHMDSPNQGLRPRNEHVTNSRLKRNKNETDPETPDTSEVGVEV